MEVSNKEMKELAEGIAEGLKSKGIDVEVILKRQRAEDLING